MEKRRRAQRKEQAEPRTEHMGQQFNEMEPNKSIETRVAVLEAKMSSYAATEWVKDFIKPVQDSVNEMRVIVHTLGEKADALFDAHDSLLKEKAQHERQQWNEKTPLGIVKKYAPFISFIIGVVAVYRILGSVVETWLRSRGM